MYESCKCPPLVLFSDYGCVCISPYLPLTRLDFVTIITTTNKGSYCEIFLSLLIVPLN
jgi:hypothetical protein